MSNRRGSLMLIELMISIAAFIVCFAVCLSIFVSAQKTSERSEQLNAASLLAQNVAEQFKGTDGDEQEFSRILQCGNENIVLYYTRDMQRSSSDNAYYRLTVELGENQIKTAHITVLCGGAEVYELTAACFSGVTQ